MMQTNKQTRSQAPKSKRKRNRRKRTRRSRGGAIVGTRMTTMTQVDLAALVSKLPPEEKSASKRSTSGDYELIERKKSPEEKGDPRRSALALLKGFGSMFTRGDFKLVLAGTPTVNSSAGKFLQFIATTTTQLTFGNLSVAAEFSTLDALFDEVFIHSVTIVYKPRNKYSAITTAAVAADLNTCAALIYFLPSGATQYTDNSAVFQNAAVTTQHKLVNMGENWTFSALNPTKFAWDGINVAASSGSTRSMGWMLFSDVSSLYGGFISMATNVSSGATAGFGSLVEGGQFGDYHAIYDISVRQRA